MEPVLIDSLLDTDMYKLTMQQAMFHKYTSAMTRWAFKCRDGSGFPDGVSKIEYLEALNKSIDHLCTLRYRSDELGFLANVRSKAENRIFKDDFIEYLRMFQLNRQYINAAIDRDGDLVIELLGPWVSVSPFEVPVLAIIAELNTNCLPLAARKEAEKEGWKRLDANLDLLNEEAREGFRFADFGTRRRYSQQWHENVICQILTKGRKFLAGTSNLHFAYKYGLTPIGTMAHEWFQAHQQLGGRLVDSQKDALEAWAQEYRGELGIALSDICGFDAFLRDFDMYFAKLFDGCRHDSGDPVGWCNALVNTYSAMGIDPKTKTAVFSDGLDFNLMLSLFNRFNKYINVSFGIGTNLTNNMGIKAPNIVLKMVELNYKPVAKVSDSPGKGMCEDPEFEAYLRKVFQIEE